MTTPLENEVLNALFRQEKPIIFSLKAGLEKLGKGHHKTSHMNRSQHADALMKGLTRTKGSKEDWTEGNLWGRVLDFANKKKPLNDERLNKIWEEVKRTGSWDEERFKGVGEQIVGGFASAVTPGRIIGGEKKVVVPAGPDLPPPAPRPEPDKQLLKAKDDRIALLEKRNRELLNELQAIRRADKGDLKRERQGKDFYMKESERRLRRLAFYEAGKEKRIAELTEEYDPEGGDKEDYLGRSLGKFTFKPIPQVRDADGGISAEYEDYILLGIEDQIILFHIGSQSFYAEGKDSPIGKGDHERGSNTINNVEFSDYKFRTDIGNKRRVRLRDLPLKTQIKELNKQIDSYMSQDDYGEEGTDPFILGPYGPNDDEIIIEEKERGSGNFVVVDNDDGEIIADWDRQEGMINKDQYSFEKYLREKEEEEHKVDIDEDRIRPDGLIEFEFKGSSYLLNPKTMEVLDADHLPDEKPEIIGKATKGSPGDNPEGLDIIRIDFTEDTTDEDTTDDDTTDEDTDEESVDLEDIGSEVQLLYVPLMVTDLDYDEAKETGLYDSELVNDEADVLGFFNNREDLRGRIDWGDLEDFVWLSEEARQTYLETMRDLMEDRGRAAMVPQAERSVPKKIFKKVQDQQIGGMTKGHFHKEVPVILHGGELVIPKKHVEEVMRQSPLAHQISKIPPTWQKIKKIVK